GPMTAPTAISPQRRREILDALRRGTVPSQGLDAFAVGLDRFTSAIEAEFDAVAAGQGAFKAVRGEYGCGKTFFARWLQEHAKRRGFATAEVQISETETPLHHLETVYRRLVERLATADHRQGAFRSVIDGWFYGLEEIVLTEGNVAPNDGPGLVAATNALMEKKLAEVSRVAPAFAACLRAYREAIATGQNEVADGLVAWLTGQPHVSASVKRAAGVKGEVDHFAALGFLQGLLVILRDAGYCGLVLVLDEVETLQRVRADARDKALNALRQLIDEVDGGRFPGLYVLVTGTTAFFEGPQGIQRLPPLAQRLHVEFLPEVRFDNPRAPQIRLPAFDMTRLIAVGSRVRDLYAQDAHAGDRVRALADDALVQRLADGVAGKLGGKVGVAPRLFLKKLVGEVLDRVDQFEDFDPARDYHLTVAESEMAGAERRAAQGVDDIVLDDI
ncbi:MAG TPA: BREX system ATP-binding protein BrxD, partial [Oscillatoriaceae cyanobacterium]